MTGITRYSPSIMYTNHRCDSRGMKLMPACFTLAQASAQENSPHTAGRNAYRNRNTTNGMPTREKRFFRNARVPVFTGTSRYADAIRNSGTATGRTKPWMNMMVQRASSEGKEKL